MPHTRTPRVGPRMADVLRLVRQGPRAVIDVARAVGPHGSLCYGYQTIRRAVRSGIVRYGPPLPGRRGLSVALPQ